MYRLNRYELVALNTELKTEPLSSHLLRANAEHVTLWKHIDIRVKDSGIERLAVNIAWLLIYVFTSVSRIDQL